ncbi:sphingolipid C9-methyltransferase [Pisolithus orientalis]|uniref:sphingolipid C9-methyltransferase n=1 Tax=Pisolithus orientalis TaxID=936130 RepID=UPI002224735A|nr:sphingolipid C9-methyltransferase [Pisolithus orientalis]KAI6004368.1 sphingolipid C9-methyltransferase [Pisolithus orientalis]
MSSSSVRATDTPAIKNAPVAGLAEGNGYFSNTHLAILVLGVPFFVKRILPIVSRGGFKTYVFLVVVLGVPITVAYWTVASMYGKRKNLKVILPTRDIEEYITIKDEQLKSLYHGKEKIPMQIFHDAYFDGKIDFNGDVLDIMEQRHDWAKMVFTPELFKYVFMNLLPEVIVHSQSQDEEQVRGHYDRGDDFYEWFLGPRMIYTSGVITSTTEPQTLEQLQDNKLAVVCSKLNLQPHDRLLDVGCGWGTLSAFAAKNYGCDVTGITLGRNQTKFGNDRIKDNGVTPDKARILCMDYRDIPWWPRRYGSFMRQMYELLDDDGIFVLQVAGIRPSWQYEDLIWGLFMNKYIFPGADASCSLGWVVSQVEAAGFEVKNIDVLGVHYSATLWKWYLNWVSNREKVVEKYGEKSVGFVVYTRSVTDALFRWYRIWVFFLAWSTIISRQGSASVFQLTLHKNLNAYHRVNGIPSHASIHVKEREQREWVSIE